MVFRRFSSLSRGDKDNLSASAMFRTCHKGIWAFATLLYHVVQLSGGLGQTLKQSAHEFKSMFWLTKGILFASQEIKICGIFISSWAKTKGFWIGRMRQEDVWHLKFRDSEIYMWCHISEFNLLEAQQAEESRKGRVNITFRPQIAATLVAEFVVWAAESAMVQICWFRV